MPAGPTRHLVIAITIANTYFACPCTYQADNATNKGVGVCTSVIKTGLDLLGVNSCSEHCYLYSEFGFIG